MVEPTKTDDSLRVTILLAQHGACANHHMGFYNLIWQLPSVAIAIGGGLTGIVFSVGIPTGARILLLLVGTVFMAAMAIALERFRMFQIRRRKDLEDLETDLKDLGARPMVWDGAEIVRQIDSGELRARGLPLRRFEGFTLLRGLMYLITIGLFGLTLIAIAAAYGAGPLATA